jgi:hypothetical protein
MTVWRLNAHPSDAGRTARWFTRDCLVAMGWGDVGDLRRASPSSSTSIATMIRKADPDSTDSQLGGQALWCFFHDMVVGDLVLVSDGANRDVVMRIDGDYEWSARYHRWHPATTSTSAAPRLPPSTPANCGPPAAAGSRRRRPPLAACPLCPAGRAGAREAKAVVVGEKAVPVGEKACRWERSGAGAGEGQGRVAIPTGSLAAS